MLPHSYCLIKRYYFKNPAFALSILALLTSFIFFINNVTIVYDGLYDADHFIYYIMLSIHTSACLILLVNVRGIYKQSKRAIIYSMISLVLIFLATLYTYASIMLLTWLIIIFILLILAYRRAKVFKRPFRLKT